MDASSFIGDVVRIDCGGKGIYKGKVLKIDTLLQEIIIDDGRYFTALANHPSTIMSDRTAGLDCALCVLLWPSFFLSYWCGLRLAGCALCFAII